MMLFHCCVFHRYCYVWSSLLSSFPLLRVVLSLALLFSWVLASVATLLVVTVAETNIDGGMALVIWEICSRASVLQFSLFLNSEYLLWEKSLFLFNFSSSSPWVRSAHNTATYTWSKFYSHDSAKAILGLYFLYNLWTFCITCANSPSSKYPLKLTPPLPSILNSPRSSQVNPRGGWNRSICWMSRMTLY